MTIGANDRHVSYTAAAGQTVFDADFPIAAAAEIEVWRDRAGTVAKLVQPTDYTVTNVGLALNARITLVAGATVNDVIVLQGQRGEARATDYITDGDFRADDINAELDRIFMHLQELQRDVERAPRKRPTSPTGAFEAEGAALQSVGHINLANKTGAMPAAPPTGYGQLLAKMVAGALKLIWRKPDNTEVDLSAAADQAAAAAASAASASGAAATATAAATSAGSSLTTILAALAAAMIPSSIAGKSLKVLRVKADESGYEHVDAGGDVVAAAAFGAQNQIIRAAAANKTVKHAAPTISDTGDVAGLGFLEFGAIAAPATPAAGGLRLYKKTGTTAVFVKDDTGAETQLGGGASGHGQCILSKSGTNLLLQPFNGNQLIINGKAETIPDAGVTLAPTGLAASTTYFVYAYMSAGTMTLEASATAHATSTTAGNKGVEIKSGADTRSLVGMARTDGSTAWIDTEQKRFVLSWFNRKPISTTNKFTASRNSTTGSTYTEVNSEIRNEFLLWSGDSVLAGIAGSGFLNTSTDQVYVGIGFDSAAPEDGNMSFQGSAAIGPLGMVVIKSGLSEGYHYATVTAKQTVGSAALTFVSASSGQRCALSCLIRN